MKLFGFLKVLSLLVLLQACATTRPDLDAPTETEVTRNLRTAFDYLYRNYYDDDFRLERVVIPGLENLRTLEPNLRVALARSPETGSFVEVRLGDELIYKVRDPAWYAGDGWAAVVRDTIKSLKAASPAVAKATWVETTDLVLAGVSNSLGEDSAYISRAELKAVGLARETDDTDPESDVSNNRPKGSAGIRLRYQDGTAQVAQVRRNSSAAQAGLRVGDIVETIAGQPADTYSRLQTDMQFVGEPDSEMRLTVRGGGDAQVREIVLRRERVNLDTPVAVWRDGLLYLQVTSLWGDTIDAVKRLVQAEQDKGAAAAAGIILDLRGTGSANPYAAARFLDIFDDGDERYFRTEGKSYIARHSFRPREAPTDTEIPLVVLVNGETAGAAEGMAATLADRGRAVVMGSTTLGQGRLQSAVFLLNGGLFAYTQALLFSAAGYAIEKRGVLPRVCSSALGSGEQALARLRDGRGLIGKATRNREIDSADAAALAAQRDLCPPRFIQSEDDVELAEAILGDPALYAAILAGDRS